MNTILHTLDRLEGFRQQIEESPVDYSGDYIILMCEAIVADEAGYTDRKGWKSILDSEPESDCGTSVTIPSVERPVKIVFCAQD